MTKVEPILHSHGTAQATKSSCDDPAQYQTSRRRICDRSSRTEKCFLRVLRFALFRVISLLLHIHLFIYLSLPVYNSNNLQRC